MVQLGFKDCGYDHINIDDGFFGGRDAEGHLLIHPERFPNGLRPLVDYIHSQGLKAGIYSDAGRNTCASYWGKPKDEIGKGVGLYGHDADDFDLYFNRDKLNFDFIKIDWCGGKKLGLDEMQRYTRIREIIDSVSNKHIDINICRWKYPGTWVVLPRNNTCSEIPSAATFSRIISIRSPSLISTSKQLGSRRRSSAKASTKNVWFFTWKKFPMCPITVFSPAFNFSRNSRRTAGSKV